MAPSTCESARLVVLISGSGSNLQAIIDAQAEPGFPAHVAAVVSNRPEAYGLQRAAAAGIPTEVVPVTAHQERAEYDRQLATVVASYAPDLVVLAGWMRLLTANFVGEFSVINLHPALPGEYPGLRAIERAFADAQNGDRTSTGVMVHFVPDEGMDDGPVIATTRVPIEPDDTIDTLTERVHTAEHALLISAIASLCADRPNQPNRPMEPLS